MTFNFSSHNLSKFFKYIFQRKIWWRTFYIFIAICIIIFVFLTRPPQSFPRDSIIHISTNTNLSDIARTLSDKHIIRSPFLYKIGVILFSGQKSVIAGDYLFQKSESVWNIAYRMTKGDFGIPKIKITIPEGTKVDDIALILLQKFKNFNAPYFVKIAKESEGYLFPDTYYFLPKVSTEEILDMMKENFKKRTAYLLPQISFFRRSLGDIVIMASILEEEANTTESRKIISGILWKRLDENMLLQVDAPLVYITSNKSGYTSIKDTKIDSPYNTYKYKGLPKGPISNPGLNALESAISPKKSFYWYYLSGKDGNIYYALDYDGHLANKYKYLR